jgi:hypothetical protein
MYIYVYLHIYIYLYLCIYIGVHVGGKPVSGPQGGSLGIKPRVNFDNNNISNIKKDKISKNFIEINKQKCHDSNNGDKNEGNNLKVNENNDDDDNDKSCYENDESYYPEEEEEVEDDDDDYNARFVPFITLVFIFFTYVMWDL